MFEELRDLYQGEMLDAEEGADNTVDNMLEEVSCTRWMMFL